MKTWAFDNDELFDLVKSGRKTATCSLYLSNEPIPKVGEISVIKNSQGDQIKIKLMNVFIRKFCDIDAGWAKKEGEGDLSLTYWEKVHKRFFMGQCRAHDIKFTPQIQILCEEFISIY